MAFKSQTFNPSPSHLSYGIYLKIQTSPRWHQENYTERSLLFKEDEPYVYSGLKIDTSPFRCINFPLPPKIGLKIQFTIIIIQQASEKYCATKDNMPIHSARCKRFVWNSSSICATYQKRPYIGKLLQNSMHCAICVTVYGNNKCRRRSFKNWRRDSERNEKTSR